MDDLDTFEAPTVLAETSNITPTIDRNYDQSK